MSRMLTQKLYDVVTLYECMQDPATMAWLVHLDVPLPPVTPSGRYPEPARIREIIESIPGIQADYLISESVWQVSVRSRNDISWAILTVKAYSGDPHTAHEFYFSAGWDEMILMVTSNLAKYCGPLVLMHDSGALPQVVV